MSIVVLSAAELCLVTNGSILALLLLLSAFDLQFAALDNLMRPNTMKSSSNSQNSNMVRAENPMYNPRIPPMSESNLSTYKERSGKVIDYHCNQKSSSILLHNSLKIINKEKYFNIDDCNQRLKSLISVAKFDKELTKITIDEYLVFVQTPM